MSRYAEEKGGTFKQLDPGTHVARCISLIDIGLQAGEYEGRPTLKSKVILGFEVPSETIEIDGEVKPMVISRFITNSLSERSQMRPMLETWRGKTFSPEELVKFDLATVLGAPALIGVVHADGKARIQTVSKLAKGMTCPPAVNPLRQFWLDEYDRAGFDALSTGIQKLVATSVEWKAFTAHETPVAKQGDAYEPPAQKGNNVDDFDEEVPF